MRKFYTYPRLEGYYFYNVYPQKKHSARLYIESLFESNLAANNFDCEKTERIFVTPAKLTISVYASRLLVDFWIDSELLYDLYGVKTEIISFELDRVAVYDHIFKLTYRRYK